MQSTVAVYNNRVFGGWDYAITNPKAAIVKKANLRREFKVVILYNIGLDKQNF